MKSKRFHRKCDNCRRAKHLPFRPDPGEHFLCERCDDAYIAWKNAPGMENFWLSDFLRSSAARAVKLDTGNGRIGS